MFAVEWSKALRLDETSIQLLEKIEEQVLQELKTADTHVLSALVWLNEMQMRDDAFDLEEILGIPSELWTHQDMSGITTENDSLVVDVFHWTLLHYEAATGEPSSLSPSDFLTAVNMRDLSGQTPLHVAVGTDNIRLLSNLLEAGAFLDDKRTDGKTALHCAVLNAKFDSVRMLIEAGANVNATDNWKQTPLHLAAWFGDRETIHYLLKSANSLAADIEGRTPLHISVLSRFQWSCESFLDVNKDLIHATDERGWTPLHLAVSLGSMSLVKLLTGCGARIKKKAHDSPQGQTPLDLAASGGHEDIVGFLLENNAYPVRAARTVLPAESRTPLYYAVVHGQRKTMELLLDHGLTVYEYTDLGKTLLHYAAQQGMAEMIPRLISRGVYVDSRDETHRTPLHCAAEHGETEAARSLLEAQAKVDARTYPQHQTPLFTACKLGRLEVAQLLLAYGASLRCSDQDGKSPLHIAAEAGHLPLVQLLVENNVDVDILIRDHSHMSTATTPLAYAALAGYVDIVHYLLHRGKARMIMNDAYSCLKVVVQNGHLQVISALIQAEPGLNAAAKAKALLKAASCGQLQILVLLVQSGASYTTTDRRKRTGLHHAASGGWHEIVDRLLDLGVDANTVDVDGQTALHKAAQGPRDSEEKTGHELTIQLLIARGARVDARDNRGRTPLFIAARHIYWPVLRQFIRTVNENMHQDLALAISETLRDQGETPTRSAVQAEIQALIERARAMDEDKRKQSLATDGQSKISASAENSDENYEVDSDDSGE
ncbi:uncharacterized protein LDX57_000933 [Aspergillus melleus]|uniref:uncharacterized protein n=1 Tax=Aspergillus melleus TaxID=138277 RepID=UPI001E8CA91F|nr:uncharacterized protein LDX57_000933 [Aspergillus melleus]KAH8423179.1 hypothetical protein LDX57_000933 [Aspergillus melleus]